MTPSESTASVSLWELQFRTPEGLQSICVQATCLGAAIAIAEGYLSQGSAFVSGGLG